MISGRSESGSTISLETHSGEDDEREQQTSTAVATYDVIPSCFESRRTGMISSIHSSWQLKEKVRKVAQGSSIKTQIILRTYAMERFLERLSLSSYRNFFVLKGGTLISSMVGLDVRSTMDVDATINGLPLSHELVKEMIETILSIHIDDGMVFKTNRIITIMDGADYPGIRVMVEG